MEKQELVKMCHEFTERNGKFQTALANRAKENPAAGDGFSFPKLSDVGVPYSWILIHSHPEDASFWFMVPVDAYSFNFIGTCDVLESNELGTCAIRCSFGQWAKLPNILGHGKRDMFVSPDSVRRVKRILEARIKGNLTGTNEQKITDGDSEYLQLCEEFSEHRQALGAILSD